MIALRKLARSVSLLNVSSISSVTSSLSNFSSHAPSSTQKNVDDDVVIPELFQTLEWTLSDPPPLHQFDEAPTVVETFGPVDPFH